MEKMFNNVKKKIFKNQKLHKNIKKCPKMKIMCTFLFLIFILYKCTSRVFTKKKKNYHGSTGADISIQNFKILFL